MSESNSSEDHRASYQTAKDGVNFSFSTNWSEDALNEVFQVIRNASSSSPDSAKSESNGTKAPQSALTGRGLIKFVNVPDIGAVAVKQYCRGGLLSLFVKELYLKSTPPRPAIEWETLQQASQLGVNVPLPLGFAIEGSLFYKAWLFTREIPKHVSLLKIAQTDLSLLPPLIDSLVSQVCILIAAGIRHVDLHPGNVVVCEDNKVYLLDFDKAHKVSLQKKDLRDQYVWRWRRSVIKHKLPEQLSELFCLGLRRSAIIDS